jgi:hypothetical protein
LRVWNDAIELFKFTDQKLQALPWELNKSKMNTLDAAHSILLSISVAVLQWVGARSYYQNSLRLRIN